MEFGFTEEQERLMREVHDYYINTLPEDYLGGLLGGQYSYTREGHDYEERLEKEAARKGWLAPNWPKEWGGMGLSVMDAAVVREEIGRLKGSFRGIMGQSIVGPALFLFGTDDQKKRWLPPIARGEVVWDEVLTEPNAGTDEANQQTRAVSEGDSYIVNGHKVFVGEHWRADWLFTGTRTAMTVPKHRGITLFAIAADSPGISYRPMPVMSGQIKNEVFFENVKVPKENMLGQLNRGFYHVMQTFEFERTMTGAASSGMRMLEEFIQFCKEVKWNGKSLWQDPQVRDKLAEIAVDIEVQRLSGWWSTWRFAEREKLGPAPYELSNYYAKSRSAPHAKAILDIMGLYGQLQRGDKHAPIMGAFEQEWQSSRSMHNAGTLEALKIVLAGRGLGLPRVPSKFNTQIMQTLQEEQRSS